VFTITGLNISKWNISTPLLYVPYAAPKLTKTSVQVNPTNPKNEVSIRCSY